MKRSLMVLALVLSTGCVALNQPNEFRLFYDGTTESVTMETKSFWGASAAAKVSVEVEAWADESWSIKINSQESQSPEGQVAMTNRLFDTLETIANLFIGFVMGRGGG